jgi:hypothetical protein
MKVTLALTPRLVAICSVCTVLIALLLVMLGFELGERTVQAEYEAKARVEGERKEALSWSPVAAPSPTAVLYSATAPGKDK